jgi:hypothetical protein
MTLDTLTISPAGVASARSNDSWFESLHDSTLAGLDPHAPGREALLQRLVDLSTSAEGLDWDALARIDIEGWGADEASA